jgi:large subunit ribosomal protein L18
MRDVKERFFYRVKRVRAKIKGTADRPRLAVYRGHKHIYAQLVDDDKGFTLASASTLSAEIKGRLKYTDNIEAAKSVGELIAKKAADKNIKDAVFDRRGYEYSGKVKALADAARGAGLSF